MFGSVLLDVAIGLLTLFLTLSMMASAVNEFIANLLQLRGRALLVWLRDGLTKVSKDNTLLMDTVNTIGLRPQALQGGLPPMLRARLPSYISKEQVVQGVINGLHIATDAPEVWAQAQESIAQMPDSGLKVVLTNSINQANKTIETLSKQVGDWFDGEMNRLSSLYKQATQWRLIIIGLIIAGGFNIDTIAITNDLLVNPTRREAIVAQSQTLVNAQGQVVQQGVPLEDLTAQLAELELPIGWGDNGVPVGSGVWDYLLKILGILVTAFAVSQGAPFWFDLLNKVTNLRSGTRPQDAASNSIAPQPIVVQVVAPPNSGTNVQG
jgi:hypothetical protein